MRSIKPCQRGSMGEWSLRKGLGGLLADHSLVRLLGPIDSKATVSLWLEVKSVLPSASNFVRNDTKKMPTSVHVGTRYAQTL